MARLQFLSKYRETGLLLFRASLGLIFIILIAPILWSGQGSWEHFGSAMRHSAELLARGRGTHVETSHQRGSPKPNPAR